jgi:hypothetical protein
VIIAILAVFALGGLDLLRGDTRPGDDAGDGDGIAPTVVVPTVAPGGMHVPRDRGLADAS